MSVSKIKSLVIAALCLINIAFAVVIVRDNMVDALYERQLMDNAVAILEMHGISVDLDRVITHGALRTMRTARSQETEERIARAVLGSVTVTAQGGGIYLYESAVGAATFFGDGAFDIRIQESSPADAGGTVETVQRLLHDMGIETTAEFMRPDAQTIVVFDVYRGVSIFNSTIQFVFDEESRLLSITGRYITGIEPAAGGAEISSAATALLDFLAAVRRGGFESARIYRVEAGYQYNAGEGVLVPAWLIEADIGIYIIDDITGDVYVLP